MRISPARAASPVLAGRMAALAVGLAGVVSIVSSVSGNDPARAQVVERFEPGAAQAAAHAAGVVGGLVAIWLAVGLLQGRWRSGRAAVALLAVLAVVHAAKGLDYEEAGIALAAGLALARLLPVLRRGQAPPRRLVVALVALLAVGAGYLVALAGLLVAGHPIGVGSAVLAALRAPLRAVGIRATHPVLEALAAAVIAVVVVALRELLRPAPSVTGHSAAEHARARAIVAEHARDSIAPFVLRSDTSFFFSRGGLLAYCVLRGTAVVSGEPVGPAGRAPAILADFLALASRRSWHVVVVSARAEHLSGYRALGLRCLQIGVEAVVDPRSFSLEGPRAKVARKAARRVERAGWGVEARRAGDLEARETQEILEVEEAWRARRGGRLTGFSMAADRLWGAPEDRDDVYLLARAPDGRLRAFQRYVPYPGGLSLDAMRRLDDQPNGLSDALVVAAIERARELGCSEVSLNFSGFGHLTAADEPTRRSHLVARWLLRRLRRRFQLERLARFAQKFGPEWRPRYLLYTSRTSVPVAALRVLQAESYLRRPSTRRRSDAWRPAALPLPSDGTSLPA